MPYEILATPGKVAIELAPPDEMIGRIVKPDTAKGDNHIGTVVAINTDDESLMRVGSRVVVPRYAGAPVTIDGRDLLFMKISDVLAVLLPIPEPVLIASGEVPRADHV